MSYGFVPGTMTPRQTSTATMMRMTIGQAGEVDRQEGHHEKDKHGPMISTRSARILLPAMTVSSLVLSLGGNALPAHAGVGTVIPFDVSLKENFQGSITNSVVLLRLNNILRKRGYYQNKAVLGIYNQNPTELAVMLAGQFAGGALTSFVNIATESNGKKKALILFGPDVDIARDGTVGQVKGDANIRGTESALIGMLQKSFPPDFDEITLLGGLIIHRSKEGGKDAGEDCFQPMAITSITKDGNALDMYSPAFGDLPTSRQSYVLK